MSKIKSNFLYNSLYQILAILIPIITTPYISRTLGAEEIGLYSYSYSIAYYFSMFIILGLNNYGNRSIAMVKDNKELLSETFSSIYIMQLISGIVICTLYSIYAYIFSNTIITWLFFLFVFASVFDINWFFCGLEEFKITVIRNTIIKILTTISIFVLIKSKEDIYIYTFIMVMSSILSQIILWKYVKRFVKFIFVKKEKILNHIRPNLMLFVPVLAISLYKIMDKIMIGNMCGMLEVGYYESTEKVMQVPLALVNSLAIVMLPKITNLISNNNENKIENYIEKSMIFVCCITSSICFGIMAIAKSFVPFFYGNGFEPCINLFQVLMPSCIFVSLASVIRTQYLIPKQKDKIYISSVIIGAIINICVNIVLIPMYASLGAAIGTLLAEISVCIYQFVKVKSELDVNKYIKNSIPFVLMGIIMYLIVILIPTLFANLIIEICVKVVVGIIVYALLTLFLIRIKIIKVELLGGKRNEKIFTIINNEKNI